MPASAHEHIIEFSHVSKAFSGHQAVRDLHFGVRPRELVSIVGVTGCGKSTTFNLILGLVPPGEGQVRVDGRDPHADFDWFRRRIAVVFQDSRLLPWRTAVQNVHAGMKFAGVPKGEWDGRARSWLSRLGLAGRESAYPHELSGGQRQRVALARAFSVDPDIILCDESFSALDEVTARALRQEFVDLVRGNGKTGVVITHSIAEALAIGDRVLVLRPPAHIADDIAVPADPSAAELAALRQRILAGMTPDAGAEGGAAGGAAGQPGADPAGMMR
jgi:NitT/TauT family transport system ATP-binding protein